MATKRPDGPTFTTPKGVLRFPKLSQVDFGTDEYPKPEGEYSAPLILEASDPAVQELIAKLRPLHEQAVQAGDIGFKALKPEQRKRLKELTVNEFFTEELDKDTEEPTGRLIFKFKMPASITAKKGKNEGTTWDNRPAVFDRYTEVLIPGMKFRKRKASEDIRDVHTTADVDIGGGTTAKVSFEVGVNERGEPGYFIGGTGACGISLKLRGVQVFDIRSGGAGQTASDMGFDREDADFPSDDSDDDQANADF